MAWHATRQPQGTYYMAGKEHLIEKNEEQLGLFLPGSSVAKCRLTLLKSKVVKCFLRSLTRCPGSDSTSKTARPRMGQVSLLACVYATMHGSRGRDFWGGADEGGSWHNRPARHIQGEIQGAQGCSTGALLESNQDTRRRTTTPRMSTQRPSRQGQQPLLRRMLSRSEYPR